ncbi:acetyltransferase [Flavobacterium sp. 2]|uniref:acetyltransferase n=1 Tax=Flavobacterium sp. 2 TaxID=308053 RepID=UPI000C196DAE|nr:acetyltransferase [Flavobacterium sp. 2]PIF59341.1 acetyltransferase EpsM [Flavobacterium sp. 2]
MEKIKLLYGASGHCKVILDILKSKNINVLGILDDNPKFDFLVDIPVLKSHEKAISSAEEIIISIGDNKIRKKIATNIKSSFFIAIHASAIISETSKIDDGSVVMAGVIINSNATIGKHCIINSGAIIEHDCEINDYCHISPSASLAGNVSIGEGAHVGIGACIIQGIEIGKWATIGAGAVIIKDVPDYAVVVGNPGKIIKFNSTNE